MAGIRRLRGRVAVAVGMIVVFVLAGTGVATAAWFVTASGAGSVNAASVSFTAVGTTSLSGEYKFSAAAPGGPVTRSIVLTNTGQSPLTFSLALANSGSAALPANISLTLWVPSGACGTTPGTVNTVGTLAAPPAMPTSALAAGAAVTVCVMTKLTTTVAASQGQSVTSTPTFTGTVGNSSWKTSVVDAAFLQTVYQIGNVTGASCTTTPPTLLNGYATLRWTTVGGVTYKVVDSGNSATYPGSGSQPLRIDALPLSGSPTTLTIYAMEATYGTTSPGIAYVVTSNKALGILLASVTCPP